jgi:hypothetical protein
MKKCTKCKKTLELSEFFPTFRKGKEEYLHECKKCCSEKTRKKREEQGTFTHADIRRNNNYMKKYGITLAEYNKMYAHQKGKCALCKSTESGTKAHDLLCVDHCHNTGRVRQLLCHHCNIFVGYIEKNLNITSKAINYIRKHDKKLSQLSALNKKYLDGKRPKHLA